MMKLFTLLGLIFLPSVALAQVIGWHIETLDGGDPAGENVGLFSSIATDINGDLHLGYVDQTENKLRFGTRDDWNSWSSFTLVSGSPSADESFGQTDLLVESVGTEWDRYFFYFYGPDNFSYKKIAPDGTFTTTSLSFDVKGDFSAAMRAGQFPHVIVRDKGTSACSATAVGGDDCLLHRWMRDDGTTWSAWERVKTYRVRGRNALAVGSDGKIHVVMMAQRSDFGVGAVGLIMRYDRYSLTADGSGYNMASPDNGIILISTTDAASEARVRDAYVSMTLDSSDNPYLCYYNPVLDTLFYGAREDGATRTTTQLIETDLLLPPGTEVGKMCDIAYTEDDNRLHIVYFHPGQRALKYTRKIVGAAAWETPTFIDQPATATPASTDVGSHLSLAVDPDGFAHVSYYDVTNQSLKYATTKPLCGDGVISSSETCDDGNTTAGDRCNATCQTEVAAVVCGNGTCEAGETSDDCPADCGGTVTVCGNNTVESGEQCDDGDLESGDGCSSTCTNEAPPSCGDNIRQTGEACDDGNTTAGDGCSATCQTETPAGGAVCGNNVKEGDEQCDDGNTTAGDGCSATCRTETPAGGAVCGNSRIETGEDCDDGNTTAGDGCDATCKNEGRVVAPAVNPVVPVPAGKPTRGGGCTLIPLSK